MDVVLVKLGGSLITDKAGQGRARRTLIEQLASEIHAGMTGRARLVIGHGSGSFGHVAAAAHGVDGLSSKRHPPQAISDVQTAAHDLHRTVVKTLHGAGVPTFSVPPSACSVAADGTIKRFGPTPPTWLLALERGLVPVTCGDIVLGADGTATICSTESVLHAMAVRVQAAGHRVKRAIWLGVTDGVLDAEARTIDTLEAGQVVATAGSSEGQDVTGGMKLRVDSTQRLARKGVESWILDGRQAGVLEDAMRGRRTGGTRVIAKSR